MMQHTIKQFCIKFIIFHEYSIFDVFIVFAHVIFAIFYFLFILIICFYYSCNAGSADE